MKNVAESEYARMFGCDTYGEPGHVANDHIVTSVIVIPTNGCDEVTVYNRGGNAGVLRVNLGDGEAIAALLLNATEDSIGDSWPLSTSEARNGE